MVNAISKIEQVLLEKLRVLPLEKQQEVLDFAEFLSQKIVNEHSIDIRELSGILHQPGQKTVSIEAMNAAIAQCAGESD